MGKLYNLLGILFAGLLVVLYFFGAYKVFEYFSANTVLVRVFFTFLYLVGTVLIVGVIFYLIFSLVAIFENRKLDEELDPYN